MGRPIVHLCYCGTSGATRGALNIALGSRQPGRHAYVLFGVGAPRQDYLRELDSLGCTWRLVAKRRGLDPLSYRRAALAIRDLQPAVVFIQGSRLMPVALWLRWLAPRVPVAAVEQGPLSSAGMRLVTMLLGGLARQTVVLSEDLARLIEARPLLRWACGRLRVIPNGINVDFWRAEPPWPHAGTSQVGMVATLERFKDHPTLLQAVAKLAHQGRLVQLHLVGGGSLEAQLRNQADGLGIGQVVRFEGDLGREAVRTVLHRLDVLVLASHGEGQGVAIVEGMAAARPIVVSDVAGLRGLIEHERTGLLAPPGDAEAMAGAIARLLDDPALARRLALAARQEAEDRYSAARMAERYEALAEELIGPGES